MQSSTTSLNERNEQDSDRIEEEKRIAAEKAARTIIEAAKNTDETLVVGLGTGSTAAYAIRYLGQAVDRGLDIKGIHTSFQSHNLAHEEGVPLADLDYVDKVHYAIDGADQFAGQDLIKGGGAAHAREWIVDTLAEELHIVVDSTKETETLDHFVPVEIEEDVRNFVKEEVRKLGGEPKLRRGDRKDGPLFTDNHFLILDCYFDEIENPEQLARELDEIPGVFRHGLFVNMVDYIHIGRENRVETRQF